MYTRNEKIVPVYIEDEMRDSYVSYAMSVIVGRALPDVRDGLKPVHRRILYAMKELNLEHNKPHKKCARITGEVLGKFHPHGDMAVYDALVRMVQDFSLRYPLVDGQGNFGCFTKDTKVRLTDGRSLSFGQLIKETREGKKNYTYTFNHEKGKVEITEIKKPRLTKKKAKIVKVILDNGEEIKCTPNHRFMLRDGTYRKARDLKPEDSLMPLYAERYSGKDDMNLKDYEVVYQPIQNTWELAHHLADSWNLEDNIYNIQNALSYFSDFQDMVNQAKGRRNHEVKAVKFLAKREDVYDLTIEKTHNFALARGVFVHNSIDGDPPAAMRYSEARLAAITDHMLADIEKETVQFMPNFDDTLKEPTVLPAELPNLLVNGSSGIAVGMATNMPPHNLSEIIDGVVAVIDSPDIEIKDLMKYVKGPDFPTGGIICGKEGIIDAYKTGRGRIVVHAKASTEELKSGKQQIVITEIPYQVNKASLIESIAELVTSKRVEGITDLRDESDKDGMRIVIELRRDQEAQVVLNQLYKHTQMQTTFGIISLALVNNRPEILNLKQLIHHYIEHRKEIVVNRTKFDLAKAEERAHILEGLKICLKNLDKIVNLIKKSKDPAVAKEALMEKFDLSERQAQAILEMQLQRLTGLEREKIDREYLELLKKIEYLKGVLESEKKVFEIIKNEAAEIKKRFGDERRTEILGKVEELEMEDLIAEEDVVITISHSGYIKRFPVSSYKKQRRGGKGITGAETKEEDFIHDIFIASTHDNMLFFTTKGKAHLLKVYDIPQAGRLAKGKSIVNLLSLSQEEAVTSSISVKEFEEDKNLIMVTKEGKIKKTALAEFANIRRGGINAISIRKGDSLVRTQLTGPKDEVFIATREGKAIRFPESQIRRMGRNAAGVRGIRLGKKDDVVSMAVVRDKKATLLTVTKNGYGKRTEASEYRVQSRGGKGIINMKVTSKNGPVVGLRIVSDRDDIMLITHDGMVVRCPVKDIRATGRSAQGVRIIRLDSKDSVTSVAIVVKEEDN